MKAEAALISQLVSTFGAVLIIFALVIVGTRLVGLRSFSKMSSFDFAMTIAVGSVIATGVIGPHPPVLASVLALAAIFLMQASISWARRLGRIQHLLDNEPMLLMEQGRILHDNLRRCRVTEDDLRAKLREANVLRQCEVRAVVFETTGDISVLHGPPVTEGGAALEDWLLEAVRRS